MRKAAGETAEEDTQMTGGSVQRLVTADGTYATQSAFSTKTPAKQQHERWLLDAEILISELSYFSRV